jgi:hypothetical protein
MRLGLLGTSALFTTPNVNGFVKSPSVPLGAGLRGNFVVVAHLEVRLPPQFLRAGSRLRRESFLQSHRFADFLRNHQY